MTQQLERGTVVGDRYVVDEFIARGGFASVYRAHHQQIGRRLAIKVLEPPGRHASDDTFRNRFLSEAKIAARIEHPGVVSVFDFGLLDDGRAFIAMDLLDGHDLDAELKEHGPVPASRFIPMFAECLGALAEGHSKGIVHKDLKPSNLFIAQPGQNGERLVILDFGIARAFDDPGAHVTQEGGFSGTPAYLAPEYIRHQTVTPAMDVYQMGLILIEALTGSQAVRSETSMGYLLAHCLEPVRLPAALLDTELGAICLRAVEKDPMLRYQNAQEFREAVLEVPRPDLFDTREIFFERAAPAATGDDLAKTLQFIDVPVEALRQISEPIEAPPDPGASPATQADDSATIDLKPDDSATIESVVPPAFAEPDITNTTAIDAGGRANAVLVGVMVFVLLAIIGAVLTLISLDPDGPPPTEPPEAVPLEPAAAVPVDLGWVEFDAAPPAPDTGSVADVAVDFGATVDASDSPEPVVQSPPPRPRPRPKPVPRLRADPKPERPPDKPAKPLLLSP